MTTALAPRRAATAASAAVRLEVRAGGRWHPVCGPRDLVPGRGVAALLPDGTQVAVFADRAGRRYAVGNRDPFTGACVLSRGLLGSAGGRAFVASPLLKQRFDLATGRCLDDEEVSVAVYPVREAPAPAGPAPATASAPVPASAPVFASAAASTAGSTAD